MPNRIDIVRVQFDKQDRGRAIVVIRQNSKHKYQYSDRRHYTLITLLNGKWHRQALHFTSPYNFRGWTFVEYLSPQLED